jgi:di/tricarboxylate transporter
MLLSAFLILIHLGFASATALSSTMIPIVMAVVATVQTPNLNAVGLTLLLQFVISFGFILPVNAPQNMIAYGTGTFEVKDFVKTGLVLTVIAYCLLAIFAKTYWSWLGYLIVS